LPPVEWVVRGQGVSVQFFLKFCKLYMDPQPKR
jgi:hypothetical protein